MTGYELPLRAIREQIASAVDLIVHTARLKDGTRKVVNITEVYGIEDDEILTQDIFAFEQTGVVDGKIAGELAADRASARRSWPSSSATASSCRPASSASRRRTRRSPSGRQKGRSGVEDARRWPTTSGASSALGKARGRRRHGLRLVDRADRPGDRRRSSRAGSRSRRASASTNLKAKLEGAGSSLDKVVWANWSLKRRRPSSTSSTRNGCAGSRATRRSASGR